LRVFSGILSARLANDGMKKKIGKAYIFQANQSHMLTNVSILNRLFYQGRVRHVRTGDFDENIVLLHFRPQTFRACWRSDKRNFRQKYKRALRASLIHIIKAGLNPDFFPFSILVAASNQ